MARRTNASMLSGCAWTGRDAAPVRKMAAMRMRFMGTLVAARRSAHQAKCSRGGKVAFVVRPNCRARDGAQREHLSTRHEPAYVRPATDDRGILDCAPARECPGSAVTRAPGICRVVRNVRRSDWRL